MALADTAIVSMLTRVINIFFIIVFFKWFYFLFLFSDAKVVEMLFPRKGFSLIGWGISLIIIIFDIEDVELTQHSEEKTNKFALFFSRFFVTLPAETF
jgi:hypothetical protein